MVEMTHAQANKMLQTAQADIKHLLTLQKEGATYEEIPGIEPVIPDYDFNHTYAEVNRLQAKIIAIKHAANVFNAKYVMPEVNMTIDEGLVRMAQLSQMKSMLDNMRKRNERVMSSPKVFGKSVVVTYDRINYDLEDVKREYVKVESSLAELQLAIDRANNTVAFPVDI